MCQELDFLNTPHDVQSAHNDDLWVGPTEQRPPPGTNIELLDPDDVPSAPDAVDPPVASRYPPRVNRHPPQRFDDFVSHGCRTQDVFSQGGE